jgi:hypothetical protein
MDDGIIVNFTNDVVILFTANMLWNNRQLGEEKIVGEATAKASDETST